MSFTADIKKEIVNRRGVFAADKGAQKACFSAFVRTSGALGVKDGMPTFFLVSETEYVAEYFTRLFLEIFGLELFVTYVVDKAVFLAVYSCNGEISYVLFD